MYRSMYVCVDASMYISMLVCMYLCPIRFITTTRWGWRFGTPQRWKLHLSSTARRITATNNGDSKTSKEQLEREPANSSRSYGAVPPRNKTI